MIKSLFITSSGNTEILWKALEGLEHANPFVFNASDWNLKCFINSDLKNYMDKTHFILDISAFIEKGDEFIETLCELREKHEKAVIIIYCCNLIAGDSFLHQLIAAGFTNIIARYGGVSEKENSELMQVDLREALTDGLSEQKWERFLLQETLRDETAEVTETEEYKKPDYSGFTRDITVFGSQRRIGTTTFAMNMCRYVYENGGKAALVLCDNDAEKEFEMMRNYFDCVNNNGHIVVNGFDVYTSETVNDIEEHNLVVFDCGDIHQNADKIEQYGDVDVLYLCCGVGWKELHHTSTSHISLQSITYTVVANTDSEELLEKHKDELCKNCNEVIGVKFDDFDRIGELFDSGIELIDC